MKKLFAALVLLLYFVDFDGVDLDKARCTLGTASALECSGGISDAATETQVTP
jgi:hypothetical protein